METTKGTAVRVMSKDGARCLLIGTVVGSNKHGELLVFAMGRKHAAKPSQVLPLKAGLS